MRSNQTSQARPVPMNALTGRFRRMKGMLSRKGWAQHDADDLIQEAFLRMQLYSGAQGHAGSPVRPVAIGVPR